MFTVALSPTGWRHTSLLLGSAGFIVVPCMLYFVKEVEGREGRVQVQSHLHPISFAATLRSASHIKPLRLSASPHSGRSSIACRRVQHAQNLAASCAAHALDTDGLVRLQLIWLRPWNHKLYDALVLERARVQYEICCCDLRVHPGARRVACPRATSAPSTLLHLRSALDLTLLCFESCEMPVDIRCDWEHPRRSDCRLRAAARRWATGESHHGRSARWLHLLDTSSCSPGAV